MKKLICTILTILSFAEVTNAAAPPPSALNIAKQAFQKQDYRKAAIQFHKIVFSKKSSENDKMMARYFLGVSLLKLKIYQTAAYPLIVAAQGASPKMAQRSFENLAMISDYLGDTGLLDYTLKRLDSNDLSELAKEIYFIRMGQALMREKKYPEATNYLKQSLQINANNEEALYTLALVYLKQNNTDGALPLLQKIYDKHFNKPITDQHRGAAAMALARASYQAKRFDDAANLYREIPKDHPLYREAQMELSWSLFRQAKFRSAMSTIQTLQTPFYENFYDPESLILRSIILLFACQADESDKALTSFQKNYASAFSIMMDVNNSNQKPDYFYTQIEEAQKYLKDLKRGARASYGGQLPFFVVRGLMEAPTLKSRLGYLEKIKQEKLRVTKLFNRPDENAFRQYSLKILNTRQKNAGLESGTALKNLLVQKTEELSFLSGDLNLIRYEVLAAKKKMAREEYIKKVNNSESSQINQNDSRDFYIKNGYRYWPFDGEYWRDEIGNYQYLGVNRCDKD